MAEDLKYRTKMGNDAIGASSGTYYSFGPYSTLSSSVVGYVNLNSNEHFFTGIEVFSDQVIVATGTDASIAIKTALTNASGSLSSYAWLVHNLIQTRNLSDRFSNSSTGGFIDYLSYFRSSSDLNDVKNDPTLGLGDCGIVAVKKIKYGESVRPLHFQIATSKGVNFSNTTSGDGTWGIMTRDSDGASAGVIFYDLGVVLIHGPSISAAQACSAITTVTLQSVYKIWQLNAFCTAGADDFRYSDNPSAFYVTGVTGDPEWNSSLTSFTDFGYQWGTTATTASATRGSYFLDRLGETWGPYITTIGLYNVSGDCLAVAKLSAPLKKPQTYPVTFRIALDFD